jgi:hypothetical protein
VTTAILTDVPQTALWVDLVREAEDGAAIKLDEELESYLVFVLMGHTRDLQLHGNVMALDYLLARTQRGTQRKQELRDVGDRCLLLAGLYPEQAERRLVSVEYFLAMGSRAYDELSTALKAAVADLYCHLAKAFARLVRVLMELRRHTRDIAPLLLHEVRTSGQHSEADPLFPGAVLLSGSAMRH